MANIIFITGTSTGVGKTIATGVILHQLRRRQIHALAIKPFCTGARSDIYHLRRLQDDELTPDEMNPFWFRKPLAPLVAARRHPDLDEVHEYVCQIAVRCDALLVEGAGGLLVPLGPYGSGSLTKLPCYTFADVIERLDCSVVVVAPNKLGAINHSLLTLQALPSPAARRAALMLMDSRRRDLAAQTNPAVLRRLITPRKVLLLPYLGTAPLSPGSLKKNSTILEKTLAPLLASSIVSSLFGKKKTAERETKRF